MRTKGRLLSFFLLLTFLAATTICSALTPQPGITSKASQIAVKPPIKPPRQDLTEGKITNVNMTPQDQLLTGTTAKISWTWPGHEGRPVDIMLLKNSKVVDQIATNWTGATKDYVIPYKLEPGSYSIRVQSSNSPDNKFGRVIHISRSWISIEQPKGAASLYLGVTTPITWIYQGNPGPVKIELLSGQSTNPVATISPNTAIGADGKGKFDWPVMSTIKPGNTYLIRMTSLASPAIYTETSYFSLLSAANQPAPKLKSLDTSAVYPGGTITVTTEPWNDLASWTAVVELQNGTKFEQAVTNATGNSFKIKAPNIYASYDIQTKKAELKQLIMQPKLVYLKKNTAASNRLAFNILCMNPILDSAFPTAANTGTGLTVNGGNWDMNLIYAPNMYWAAFELPDGQTVRTNVLRPQVPAPPIPIVLAPNQTLVGSFLVKTPQVFCGKTKAQQDAINNGTSKLSIYGILGPNFSSNKLDIQIRKTPVKTANPYRLTLGATYNSSAPNRTVYYTARSLFVPQDCQKVVISGVKNNSQYSYQLAYRPNGTTSSTAKTGLAPGQSTSAFNNMNAEGLWEAWGPESGSFLGKYPVLGLEITWRAE